MNKLNFLITLLAFTSCIRDDAEPEPVPAAKTVLVYMVADNNLSSEAGANLDSLLSGVARDGAEGNLLVYLDRSGDDPVLLRLSQNPDNTAGCVTVRTYSEQNSVSPSVMASVLADMTTLYPAQSYGLVLWSHGYGWLPGPGNTKAVTTRWFGQDGSSYMDLDELADVLATAPKFDYILFDACFMGGVETAYALREYANYLIASPAEVFSDGFPYSRLLPYLFGCSESRFIGLASTYYNWYNGRSGLVRSAAVGCVNCSEMENLAAATRELLGVSLDALNGFDASAVQPLDSYSPHLFYDFAHFAQSLASAAPYTAFTEQLEKTVVYSACTPSITMINGQGGVTRVTPVSFGGIGCFIPQQSTTGYNLSFQSSGWYSASGWNLTGW